MSGKERPFDPMNEPEECIFCHNFPDWLEISDDVFQCQNCYAVYNSVGKVIEEPPLSKDVEEDD